jgi:hypothetical protein
MVKWPATLPFKPNLDLVLNLWRTRDNVRSENETSASMKSSTFSFALYLSIACH